MSSDLEDVDVVNDCLERLIKQDGKEVLLVAHSSGGWVATQAAIPELQRKTRQANGQEGGLAGLFYYSAFVIPLNESINSFFQPKDGSFTIPPWLRFYVGEPHRYSE